MGRPKEASTQVLSLCKEDFESETERVKAKDLLK